MQNLMWYFTEKIFVMWNRPISSCGWLFVLSAYPMVLVSCDCRELSLWKDESLESLSVARFVVVDHMESRLVAVHWIQYHLQKELCIWLIDWWISVRLHVRCRPVGGWWVWACQNWPLASSSALHEQENQGGHEFWNTFRVCWNTFYRVCLICLSVEQNK